MSIDRVVLHIGLPKTASTTIQDHLATHRAHLLSQGILYAKSPGNRNHLRLAMYAAPDDDFTDLRLNSQIRDQGGLDRFRSQFAEELSREVERTSATTLVLSNEHCGLLPDVDSVRRLARLVRKISDSVSVVVYLRRQDDAWISSYSEYVKAGGSASLIDFGDEKLRASRDYWALLQRWEEVFGSPALEVRVFERAQLVGRDILVDFAAAAQLPLDIDDSGSHQRNPSLDAATIEFLRRLNTHVPRFVDQQPNEARGDLVDLLGRRNASGRPFMIDRATADQYMGYFAESNRLVAGHYLQRPDGKLFRDEFAGADPDPDPPEALDLDTAVELTAHLWQLKQDQLNAARRVPVRRQLKSAWRTVRRTG